MILCWNGRSFLEQFLPSVLQTTYPNAEIIVADNASTDGSAAFVAESFPSVKVIKLPENKGFATGYNQALAQVEADYYVLLNQDVEVEQEWLEPLVEAAERDATIAACQPKIRWQANKKMFEYAGAAGGFIDQYGYTFCRGRIFQVLEEDVGQYDSASEIFWESGAAMFIRAELYHKLGGLDDDFFAHMEEIDLCWRLKNAGYKIMYVPDSIVYHVGGGSLPQGNPRKTYLNFRNNLFLLYKNLPQHRFRLTMRLLLDQVAALQFLTKSDMPTARAVWKANLDYLRHLKQLSRKRKTAWEVVKTANIGAPNKTGCYRGNLLVEFFVRGKKKWSQLDQDRFL